MTKFTTALNTTTDAETALIRRIAERATALYARAGITNYALKTAIIMDIAVCHSGGCRLRLAEMAAGDDFNLMHDVIGLDEHLDRKTGRMARGFLPRYAA